MSWWHTGAEEAKREKEDKARKKGSAGRFWLKVKESRTVLFAEDVNEKTFGVHEHELKLDGDFRTIVFCTCVRGAPDMGPCLPCQKRWQEKGKDKEFARLHRNFITIFDLTPWQKDDTSDLFVCQKRVLAVKQETYELLCGKSAKRKTAGDPEGLKMWLMDITRHSVTRKDGQEMSPKVGNDFEPIAKVTDPLKLPPSIKLPDGKPHPGLVDKEGKPIDPSPYDYREILKPRTKEEIERIFASHAVTCGTSFGSSTGGGGGGGGGGGEAKPEGKPDAEAEVKY